MKAIVNSILLVAVLFLGFTAMAQRRTVKLKSQDTYTVSFLRDTVLSLDSLGIDLQLEGTWLDTCNYNNNSLLLEFKIVNGTKEKIGFNSDLNCWNDSGFQRYYEIGSSFIFLKPGETATVKVHVNNTQKRQFDTRTEYLILVDGVARSIPIRLRLKYATRSCGEPK